MTDAQRQAPARGALPTVTLLWWSLFSSGVLIGAVLLLIGPIDLGFEAVWSAVIVGFGVAGQVMRRRFEERPPSPEQLQSVEGVMTWWRSSFFLGYSLAESGLLLGFVVCFIQEPIWPYLAGIPVWLYGMWAIYPSTSNLDRYQQRITAHGSPISLENALREPATTHEQY